MHSETHFSRSSCSTIFGDSNSSSEVHCLVQFAVVTWLPLIGINQFPLKPWEIETLCEQQKLKKVNWYEEKVI